MYKALLISTFLLSSLLTNAQKYASAYIMEGGTNRLSKIIVVYETGDKEIIPLSVKNIGKKDFEEKCISNLKTITNFFSTMESKGYTTQEMTVEGVIKFVLFRKELNDDGKIEIN